MESLLFFLMIPAAVGEKYGFSPSNVERHKRFDSDSDDQWVASLSSLSDLETKTKTKRDTRSGTGEVSGLYKGSDHRCENLPVIPNGKLKTKKKYLRVGETASIKCDDIYCLSQYNNSSIRGDSILSCTKKMAKDDRYRKMPVCIQDLKYQRGKYSTKSTFNKHDPIPDDDFITAIKNGLRSNHAVHYGHLKWNPQLERRSEVKLFKDFMEKSKNHPTRLAYSVRNVRFNGAGLCDRHVASSYITALLSQQDEELNNFIKKSAKLFGCGVWDTPARRNRVHCQYFGKS